MAQIQYVSDDQNTITAVIVPIDIWRKLTAENETKYLLKSDTMKERLLEARNRKEGIPFDDACKKIGI